MSPSDKSFKMLRLIGTVEGTNVEGDKRASSVREFDGTGSGAGEIGMSSNLTWWFERAINS
ncbi:hypothetical protein QG37_05852 [Candidozyma auris]|nr:hypothetical protein QG37_05852 [[Candida] auris]